MRVAMERISPAVAPELAAGVFFAPRVVASVHLFTLATREHLGAVRLHGPVTWRAEVTKC